MDNRTRRTPKKSGWQDAFLAALEEGATVSRARLDAGVARSTVYEARDRIPEFRERWEEVVDRSTEAMEVEAHRRAVDGWVERPLFDKGDRVGEVRKYSDTLLIFLLKARRPEVYRERHTVTHTGSVTQRVRLDLSRLTDDQLAALEAIQPDVEPDED